MKIKVLVVDDEEHEVNMIRKYFEGSNVSVVGVANDGNKAIELINNLDFDIMLLDLIMPYKDGFSVLDYLRESNKSVQTIVISSCNNFDIIKKCSEYNIKYYALKPFDMDDLKLRINELYSSKNSSKKIIDIGDKDIQIKVTNILHSLGIPSNIKGYQFIRTAILKVYNNPSYIGGITKELYPCLASEFLTSTQKVERAIRHAIEVSWLRGDIDLMEEIFGHSVDIDRAKPTNSEFIVTIADKLKLDMINV